MAREFFAGEDVEWRGQVWWVVGQDRWQVHIRRLVYPQGQDDRFIKPAKQHEIKKLDQNLNERG